MHVLDDACTGAALHGATPLAVCQRVLCLRVCAGKCSALIKVSADLSDIFFGHSTWDSFTAMTRIYKHYQLNLQQVRIVSPIVLLLAIC